MALRTALLSLAATLALAGCTASSHATQASSLGRASRSSELLAVLEQPGPLEVETVNSTSWAVTRAGLINLEHPKAKAAGLTDGDEPIEVNFHVLRHPRFGTFLIDTGVEKALRDAPEKAAIQGVVASELHLEKMKFENPLGQWLAARSTPLAGVFFTHLHLDHVSGAPDLPKSTPLYAGPGETTPRALLNVFIRGNVDRALAGLPPVSEWGFTADPDGRFAGVVDVFGDGSLWAIWTPGHTPGSTAYLARTPQGPVLFTGDTSHTAWGWEHDVEPGEFTLDAEGNVKSFAALRALVKEHPSLSVRLGHQRLPEHADAR